MRVSFQFWHVHAIYSHHNNNNNNNNKRSNSTEYNNTIIANKCSIDCVLAPLPCVSELRKLIYENLFDKCQRGGDATSRQSTTSRQTQTHNTKDKSFTQTTTTTAPATATAVHATSNKQQQSVSQKTRPDSCNSRQIQFCKMNRHSYTTATATTATTTTTMSATRALPAPTTNMPTTAAITAAFAPLASLWHTAATTITTTTIASVATNTHADWLQDSNHMSAANSSNGNTLGVGVGVGVGVADDDFHQPVGSNFSYFTPAISHVVMAPTAAPSTVTSLMTSLTVHELQPGVIVHNASAVEAAAGGVGVGVGVGDGVSVAGGAATAVGAGTAAGAAGGAGAADNLNSFYFYETEQFAVLWILFTVIVLGNSAVLFVMFINKNRKSRMNYFIKQLAIADLSVGLLHVLTDIVWRMTISWRAGNVACKVIRFSQVCVTYSSTYVLVAMSIDRYDAITHPMNFSKSWKRARHLVAAAWIISALFSLPILVLYEEKLIQGQMQCWIELGSPWAWQVYMCLVSASLFAFPALIITACYAIIVKTIWAKGSIFVPAERAGYGNPATRRASSRGIIPRAKVKTVKMTFVIVIVFIVCWSPYIIFDLLQVFGQIPQTQTNIAIATFIQSLAPLNSAANPLIYCLFSSQVFRTLSRFPPFKWFSCCCRSYRSNSTQNRCNTVGHRLHHSCDSMRTLTTSLTVSRRSNKAVARVVICERPKNVLAISEV